MYHYLYIATLSIIIMTSQKTELTKHFYELENKISLQFLR